MHCPITDRITMYIQHRPMIIKIDFKAPGTRLGEFFRFSGTRPLTRLTRQRASQHVRVNCFSGRLAANLIHSHHPGCSRIQLFVYRPHQAVFARRPHRGRGGCPDQMAIVIASRVTVLQLHILSCHRSCFYDACPANWPGITAPQTIIIR